MNKTFLEYVAEDIISKYGTDLSRIAVVFPNKRAALFLNEHLARIAGQPVWSPAYITISDLFRQHTDLKTADPIKLICDIHKSFTKCTGIDETLDHFYGWGQLLLADFDDIDKNMADADSIFCNLKDIHELDDISYLDDEQKEMLARFFANFSNDIDSELKKRFLSLWSHFGDIYHDYNRRLTEQGIGYEGAIYRKVASEQTLHLKYDKYLFVGFNLLQKVERVLFSRLMKEGKAKFYWDFDEYYMPSPSQHLTTSTSQHLTISPSQHLTTSPSHHLTTSPSQHLNTSPSTLTSQRPAPTERLFVSDAVEKKIREIKKRIKENAYLAWMFENCFPNTLDTTVHFTDAEDGKEDTFVYTGDIHAMWLRDSAAQVWPYVQLAKGDRKLQKMLRGVIRRQLKCINIDPYANAFNREPEPNGMWANDMTDMKPELHERKYEIDSLCYPIRLAYHYWQVTGDASVFGDEWLQAVRNILRVFREQQRKQGLGTYRFQRETEDQLDTVCNHGWGNPVKPCGLIASVFRPSDDATTFLFLVPSNFMAVSSLRKAAEILSKVNADATLAADCTALADEVSAALKEYAVVDHPKYGKIYAYEVDGFGNRFLMDDANVPSLLALPYLGDVDVNDPVYQNTRRFVWSEDNPYFFRGKAGEGIGGPHVGYDMAWPMSIMMRAFTSTDDAEIAECLRMLQRTDAGTGFIHESFNVDDANQFTREWFAWQNTLFGELIIKLVDEGKTELLVGARK